MSRMSLQKSENGFEIKIRRPDWLPSVTQISCDIVSWRFVEPIANDLDNK